MEEILTMFLVAFMMRIFLRLTSQKNWKQHLSIC